MKKLGDLRAYLLPLLPALKATPENLHSFVEKGKIATRRGSSSSFEYRYTATLVITDFADSVDTVMVPLLAWVEVNQPDLIDNEQKRENAINFRAEILDSQKVDIEITLELTEQVRVAQANDTWTCTHLPEPVADDLASQILWPPATTAQP